MADDFDIEAMLEAPYKKDENKSSSANGREERSKKKKKSRSKSRSRSRDKKRSKSQDRKKSRERKTSKSHERKRSRSKERRRSRSRSKERGGRYRARRSPFRKRSRSKSPFKKDKSPVREPIDNLTPEERDARTVFCMQLAARIRPRDLEEFFSAVGKARTSNCVVVLQMILLFQAEKNRAAALANNLQKGNAGPMRLYVGSLHFNITEEMLRGIFEPFGRIESIQLMMDSETGRSKGYGFITFSDAECAKKALEQLNGFELAGRPMKVGHVTERTDASNASSFLDSDELERTGIDLGTTGRLQLMARLAEGTGLQIPPAAQQALQMSGSIAFGAMAAVTAAMNPGLNLALNLNPAMTLPTQPLATQCFQLSNMFNPQSENDPEWDVEIQDDVIEECNKHGGVVHIYVDKNSPQGNIYVKCPAIAAAMAAVSGLHGRWFAAAMNPGLNLALNLNPAMTLPTQPLATQCFQLSNMFNPQSENDPEWDVEIQDDVIEECNKHGGVVHIYVDKNSPQGNIYVKCPAISAAMAAVSGLHGRWFAGKMITAAYVPLATYHNLFPESVMATQLLMPIRR
ncbi:UNVERIFIED_CONTAM: hypothetical protein FKN15_057156 [Acipenser sinensis]